jgi:hypothetical protein
VTAWVIGVSNGFSSINVTRLPSKEYCESASRSRGFISFSGRRERDWTVAGPGDTDTADFRLTRLKMLVRSFLAKSRVPLNPHLDISAHVRGLSSRTAERGFKQLFINNEMPNLIFDSASALPQRIKTTFGNSDPGVLIHSSAF